MHVILFILSSMAVFSCGAILTALWLRAELEQSRADYSAAIEDAENWRAAHHALQQQYRDLQEAFITSQVNLLQEAMKAQAVIAMLGEEAEKFRVPRSKFEVAGSESNLEPGTRNPELFKGVC